MIEACFVRSHGFFPDNSSGQIPELTTSRYSTSMTVQTTILVDNGGFTFLAATNWLGSFLCSPAVRCTINWRLFLTRCIYLHPTACCCFFLLLPVGRTIFKWASWVIFLVAASAALQWTSWCLRCCSVRMGDLYAVSPANRLDIDPHAARWGGLGFLDMLVWNRRGGCSRKEMGNPEDYIVSFMSEQNQ